MQYKFYVKMDGETFGPYSAKEVRDLQLMDDILVTEESMNGDWLPAREFDFEDMARKELETLINDDGTISRPTPPQTPVSTDEVPAEIKKWNWGAFYFSWLWGICNGIYWPIALIFANTIPYVGPLIGLAGCIALGINGSEWAWKAKTWASVEEFKQVQHKWAVAAACVFAISLVLSFVIGILVGLGY